MQASRLTGRFGLLGACLFRREASPNAPTQGGHLALRRLEPPCAERPGGVYPKLAVGLRPCPKFGPRVRPDVVRTATWGLAHL